jgi:hypothetical protein
MTSQAANDWLADDFKQFMAKTLPSTTSCRAKFAGFGDYVDCLTECGYRCCYALDFGGTYLCFHPERQSIAERSKASQSPSESDPRPPAKELYSLHPGLQSFVIAGNQLTSMNPG